MQPESLGVVGRRGLLLATLSLLGACGPQESSDAGDRRPDPPAPRVATVASTDGVPIVYEVHGEDRPDTPTLVFVHGWSCDRGYWDAQVGPFAARYHVVTLDLAGHGESGLGRESWTIASYGADVAAVVEELDLEQVIFVGHSMGGDVVVDAARLVPGRIAAMVWVDTYRQLGSPRTPDQVQEVLAPLRADFASNTHTFVRGMFPPDADSTLVERVASDMSAAPPEVAIPSGESSLSNDRVVPVVLQDELDLRVVAINPDDGSTDIESMKPYGVDVVLMPDVGHFMMMEDPERFNGILMEVIEGFRT